MSRYEGTVLEGSKGTAVAVALAIVVVALAAAQWFVLPEQVVMQMNFAGQPSSYAPKWFPLLLSTGMGLFGTGWFAVSRAKTGLLLAVIGAAAGVLILGMSAVFS